MDRREALRTLAAAGLTAPSVARAAKAGTNVSQPLAVTMWEFSWLKRRWPGAGYEDWDRVLDELVGRGYNAVRIDAFPHLVSAGPTRAWELVPVWNQNDWGSPARVTVTVLPSVIKTSRLDAGLHDSKLVQRLHS